MVTRLRRATYNFIKGDRAFRSALAFAILVKSRCPASVIKDWSYRKLSRITGVSPATCKKHIQTLRSLHLVRMEVKGDVPYLVFKKLRCPKIKNRYGSRYHTPRHADIDISKIDFSSIKSIELGLCAMEIVEVQTRKNFVGQLISSARNPKSGREYKRAKRLCRKRGYEDYCDNGISYARIAQKLHCGTNTVSRIVGYGESNGIFAKLKSRPFSEDCLGVRPGADCSPWHYSSFNKVFYQPSNRFLLPSGS